MAGEAWALRSSLPRHGINVFALRDGDGLVLFDAGGRDAARELRRVAGTIGRLDRVLLSHGHPDHRGGARSLALPVFCHASETVDVEGDGGRRYMTRDGRSTLAVKSRARISWLLRDGGPVPVAGTVAEGDRVGAYQVVELVGHSPGHIGLWYERDRVLLASDCFYVSGSGEALLPRRDFDYNHSQAIEAVRRAAMLAPRAAWPAHGPPLVGDVKGMLELALRRVRPA